MNVPPVLEAAPRSSDAPCGPTEPSETLGTSAGRAAWNHPPVATREPPPTEYELWHEYTW
jgi:hypothetical protein